MHFCDCLAVHFLPNTLNIKQFFGLFNDIYNRLLALDAFIYLYIHLKQGSVVFLQEQNAKKKGLGSIEMQKKTHLNKHQHKRQCFEHCSWSCWFVSFLMHIIVHHGLTPCFLQLQQFSAGRHSGEVQLYYAFWQPILFLLKLHILSPTIRIDCYKASPGGETLFPSVIKSRRRWTLLNVFYCKSKKKSSLCKSSSITVFIHIQCHRTAGTTSHATWSKCPGLYMGS